MRRKYRKGFIFSRQGFVYEVVRGYELASGGGWQYEVINLGRPSIFAEDEIAKAVRDYESNPVA